MDRWPNIRRARWLSVRAGRTRRVPRIRRLRGVSGPGQTASPDPEQPAHSRTGRRSRRTPSALTHIRTVLRLVGDNAALGRLMGAYFLMTVAEYGEWITLLVYAYKHGGASASGLVALAQLLPSIVLAPVISAHGARLGVARLLALSYVAEAVMLAACAAAILLHAPPLVVYATAIGFCIPLGVSTPMHNVLTPLVVRHPNELTAGNVVTGWSKGAGGLAGPLLAGLMLEIQGPGSPARCSRGFAPARRCSRACARCAPGRRGARTRAAGWPG